MPSRTYLLSLPERMIRSALAFSAGLLREIGEVVVPRAVRRGQLYRSLVDVTLRYVIERVGGAKGIYPAEAPQAEDFLARRGAGHAIELLGIAALRISPVWVFAALADLTGLGRRLIPEIAEALKEQGLLEKEAQFENVDQLLDGLEKTSSRLAQTINAPPLDVAGLRKEWTEIRMQARGLKLVDLPSVTAISERWEELKDEAARQGRSIFETSSVMAISAVRALPDRARWLSSSTRVAATRTGKLLSAALLDEYSHTLNELREVGYATYARRQLIPYLRACVDQFSRHQRTLTERLIERIRWN
ncbi:MAG: hypothetical protein E6K22_02980 [Gammaproteobacteria bacterium]|nr:MAG: hypothetical protein E6K22_02980 [Gammaproteobacteria bacterium]TLZ62812.1 MAG: hypothetical protein E6K20_04145 [Gammaproteobacteria bacterium]